MPRRVIIMGAGGRDYHVFNLLYRDNPEARVVAFTATQIPGLTWRRYPPRLAGPRYPAGIPIYPEELLPQLVHRHRVDEVVLAYSDLTAEEFAEKTALVLATGARLRLPSPDETMIDSIKPVIAVTATKTGAGKSTVSRSLALELKRRGVSVAVVRHPMAYGNLEEKEVIAVESKADLEKYSFTVEELEEYEPYTRIGVPVLAGIDYEKVLLRAEELGEIIIWDGGNNDTPFIKPDIWICLVDATRPHTIYSYPGTINVIRADHIIVTKVSEAGHIDEVIEEIKKLNKRAEITLADLEPHLVEEEDLRGKKVLVIEDAPTVTHGGAAFAAGYRAAVEAGAEVVDPRPYAHGVLKTVYEKYPHLGPVLPSMGYTEEELRALEETINNAPVDAVVSATPAAIERLIRINKPVIHVEYRLRVIKGPGVAELAEKAMKLLSERRRAQ
ncbi:MAG: GTPase [Crenarchaeota archaeon]|nr:GTPase [Thermoproteota archaeon]